MSISKLSQLKTVSLIAVLLSVAIAALTLPGCKGEEEEPIVEQAPEPVAPPQPEQKPLPTPSARPVTLDILQLMPESTSVASAMPGISGIHDRFLGFVSMFLPDEAMLKEIIRASATELANEMGIESAEDYMDIVSALGIDPASPMAFFVDFDRTAQGLERAAGLIGTTQHFGASPEAAEKAAVREREIDLALEEIKIPAFAVLVHCSKPGIAETVLKEAVNEITEESLEPTAIEFNGVSINTYGSQTFSYFFSDNLLVMGNALSYVKAVASRLDDPARIRYGTQECPADEPDEFVKLVYMDKVMPMIGGFINLMPLLTPPEAQEQMAAMQSQFAANTAELEWGSDPMVATFSWTDEKLTFKTRIDYDAHPKIAEFAGPASPLRLAPMLPETTLAFISMGFNDQVKAILEESILDLVPPEMMIGTQLSQTVGRVIELLGDELTLGVTGMKEGMPSAMVMVGITSAEETQELLSNYVALTEVESHNDVSIKVLPLPVPMPLYSAFLEGVMVVGSDLDDLKAAIDLAKSGGASGLFDSLDPPLDKGTARYSTMLIRVDRILEISPPWPVPPEAQMVIDKVKSALREVRTSQGMVGNWQQSELTIYF